MKSEAESSNLFSFHSITPKKGTYELHLNHQSGPATCLAYTTSKQAMQAVIRLLGLGFERLDWDNF